ncbi:MAG: hypothetical protein ACRC6I_20335, partial [Paracoccaceae bacterium]
RAKKPPHIRVDGGGKARIWLGGQVGQPEGHHLGTDAAPFAQIAGNSVMSGGTRQVQADEKHGEERDETKAVFDEGGAGCGQDRLDVVQHVVLHLCCSFVLILETSCKELFKNICEQSGIMVRGIAGDDGGFEYFYKEKTAG